jgi:hypothetical protein
VSTRMQRSYQRPEHDAQRGTEKDARAALDSAWLEVVDRLIEIGCSASEAARIAKWAAQIPELRRARVQPPRRRKS